jgi:hypothetical protein
MPVPVVRRSRSPWRQGRLVNHLYLSFLNLEDLSPVVDMSHNEVKVPELAGPAQEIDAAAAKAGTRRRVVPTVDYFGGLPAGGPVASAHQSRCNPCAANLVFFPEFALTAGAQDGYATVTLCQIAREHGVIAKGSQIDGFTARCRMNQFGARR